MHVWYCKYMVYTSVSTGQLILMFCKYTTDSFHDKNSIVLLQTQKVFLAFLI